MKNKTKHLSDVSLDFMGKDYAKEQAEASIQTSLVQDEEHNALPENTNSENMFITGDNLEALKHLALTHYNKIKMIYIDPPYNTGNKKGFQYNDCFEFTKEDLITKLNYSEEDAKAFRKLYGKASHSAWLTFMYPRLKLARKLLSEDGVIFVSIDDNEQANLKLLMDDVFGERNFVNQFLWLHGKGKKDTWSRTSEQYIVSYAKNKNKLPTWTDLKLATGTFSNPDSDPRGEWFSGSVSFDEKRSNKRRDTYFTIKSPSGVEWTRQWQVETPEEMDALLEDKKIYFGPAPEYNHVPRRKIFRTDENEIIPSNLLDDCGTTKSAQVEVDELMGVKNVFDNPKPIKLIKTLIKISQKEDAIILDFFAGSATTAHAVMELNAEDGGNRKYIMVQLDEATDPAKAAYKAGYKFIDEIARERIKRAAKQIKENAGLLNKNMDLGFKHYRLVKSKE